MNIRERFHATMNGDSSVDRCPVIEWAGWWDKTVQFWEGEGLPPGLGRFQLYDYFGLDKHIQIGIGAARPDCPAPKSHGAPLLTSEAEYLALRPKLYPGDAVERILPQLEEALPLHEAGKVLLWYTLEGFFWFPRILLGIEPHLYAFYDEPELYHHICQDLLEWQLRMVEQLSRYVDADFVTMAEDMSYNNGPMISKDLFEEFITPYYKQLCPALKKNGTRVIVDSDGDISLALPWFIDGGVEGILPLERQAGVDIGRLQEQFPEFLFVGGFDKMSMLRGKDAIDAEFQRILPALRRGRYLPSMDHQTPPGVTLSDYRYYVSKLHEFGLQACKG